MAAGVLASFTQSSYYGRGERPNTKLADKSSSSSRRRMRNAMVKMSENYFPHGATLTRSNDTQSKNSFHS
jgi:hypothetical protein